MLPKDLDEFTELVGDDFMCCTTTASNINMPSCEWAKNTYQLCVESGGFCLTPMFEMK